MTGYIYTNLLPKLTNWNLTALWFHVPFLNVNVCIMRTFCLESNRTRWGMSKWILQIYICIYIYIYVYVLGWRERLISLKVQMFTGHMLPFLALLRKELFYFFKNKNPSLHPLVGKGSASLQKGEFPYASHIAYSRPPMEHRNMTHVIPSLPRPPGQRCRDTM